MTPEEVLVVGDDGWRVRVFPNKYPAVAYGEGGYHEVVVETPYHNRALEELSVEDIATVLGVFRKRLEFMYSDGRVKYVSVFKNHGKEAGASIPHSHSQILGVFFEPVDVVKEREFLEKSWDVSRCYLCSFVEDELKKQKRVIEETSNFACLSYYAAAFAYETWIVPKRHVSSFKDMDKPLFMELASALKGVLLRMRKALGVFSYNLVFKDWWFWNKCHFWVEVIPRITHIAGFELATGTYINPVLPEDAASQLRGE